MRVLVVVVVPEGASGIDAGSGVVVASPREQGTPDGFFRVWFEGNRHGAVNLVRWADRVHCAAERMLAQSPTVAVRDVPIDDVRALGTYDAESGRFEWGVPHWRETLSAWLGRPVVDEDLVSSVAERRANEAALRRAMRGYPGPVMGTP